MIMFFTLLLLGGWFLVIGLPIWGLYHSLKNEFQQTLDGQRLSLERQIWELTKRLNIALQTIGQRPNVQDSSPVATPTSTGDPTLPTTPGQVAESPFVGESTPAQPFFVPVYPAFPPLKITPQEGIIVSESNPLPLVNPPLPPTDIPSETLANNPDEPVFIIPPSEDDHVYSVVENQKIVQKVHLDEQRNKPLPYKVNENPTNEYNSLELQIGRKVLGWIAVLLFILGGAFFVQLAISRGWLNPTNRLIGMGLSGFALLGLGRYCYQVGWRRYSEMINSAGIVTLFSAAYYAQKIEFFAPSVTAFLLMVTVLGGFLLSASYRSMIIGYVATLGGLAIPLLIGQEPHLPNLVLYLSLLSFAVLLLVNLLGRSHLAVVSWLGTLFLFVIFPSVDQDTTTIFWSKLLFFLAFFVLYGTDVWIAAYRTKRRMGQNDFWRALFTPLIFFVGIRDLFLYSSFNGLFLWGMTPAECFTRWGGLFALKLVVLYAVGGIIFARWGERSVLPPYRNTALIVASTLISLVFLAIFVPLTFGASFFALGWLTIAMGLHCFSTKNFNLFFLSRSPNDSDQIMRRGQTILPEQQRQESLIFRGGAFAFFVLGIIRLLACDFLPNWLPQKVFLEENAFPLIHLGALPITLSCILLMLGAGIALYRRRFLPPDTHGGNDTATYCLIASVFGLTGFFLGWALVTSEFYCWAISLAKGFALAPPEIYGWGMVIGVWLLLSLAAYLPGLFAKNLPLRVIGMIVLVVTLTKVILFDLWSHPVVEQMLSLGGTSYWEHSLNNSLFTLMGVSVPRYLVPVFNPFSFPLMMTLIVAMLLACYVRRNHSFLGEENCPERWSERWFALLVGLASLSATWVLLSFETLAWCRYRPEMFGGGWFYPVHLLFCFWTVASLLLIGVGHWGRSFSIRALVYSLLIIQLPIIFRAEFLPTHWRPEGIVWPVLNVDVMPILLFTFLMMGIGVFFNRLAKGISREEKIITSLIGSMGVVLGWLMLSFEIYRYFTDNNWWGLEDWTRLFALSIFWSVLAVLLVQWGNWKNSLWLRWLGFGLTFLIACKVLSVELFQRPDFARPVLNPYSLEVLFNGFCLIILSCVQRSWLRSRKHSTKNLLINLEYLGWGGLFLFGLFILWIGPSIDVYQAIRLFPAEKNQSDLMAQMSLSIFWSCFAGVLLTIGFWRNSSLLRWLAIGLFGLTTAKVLTVDLAYVDQIWRVGAFMTLAIILAAAAAAYQRFRPNR